MNLTPQGSSIINDLANRYYVSTDAVMTLLQAVINGGGTMAQFNHYELGGAGQWMQGGMTMVGDMFNHSLKAKVDGLCSELSGILGSQTLFEPTTFNSSQNYNDATAAAGNTNGLWWPADLGTPSSSGSQNNVRYAIFPFTRRLAIEVNGQMTIYDTLNHQIGGVGQQQGTDASVTFSSQFGTVSLRDLPIVSGYSPAPAAPVALESATTEPVAFDGEGDIFAKIERLAELRHKGILTEQEFSSKKAELMSRL